MATSQILVVEDEGIVATAIKNELEQFGYGVSGCASSADEAIDRAVRDQPDLVLMDIHLNGDKDGIEAAREIRARCGTPVVYLSAFADVDMVNRAGETHAYGYLIKPYEERELLTTIEMALAKRRGEQRHAETERWLAATLEGIDDAVIATDPEYQVHFMNLAGEALTGWRKEDAVGAPFAAVCNLRDQRGAVMLDELAEKTVCESRMAVLPATTQLVSRSGNEMPVEGRLSPIYDHRGEFLGMVMTLRNIRSRLDKYLPRCGVDAPTESTGVVQAKPRAARPTVLLAEAEPMVKEFGRQILEAHGYKVLVAEDGVQAVDTFQESLDRIDLVIVDLNIPRLTGDAVLERLLALDPHVEVLFSSGYFAEDHCAEGSHLVGVISKPYLEQELVRMVNAALKRRSDEERCLENKSV